MPNLSRLVALIPLSAAVVLAGCAPAPSGSDGRPVVLTTFTVLADMTRNVGGELVQVESLTKPGAEIHGYEPTPKDIARASHADLIIDNGLGLESWFARFVADADVPHAVASEDVEPIPIASDTYAGRPNPHAWMSPADAVLYTRTIADALAGLAPEHAARFHANADAYAEQLTAVHEGTVERLASLPQAHRALVSCEGAFSYLVRDAGLSERYLWPVNADTEGTPQQVADVIEYVREHGIPAVFCESTVSDKQMRQVVEATGAQFGGTLFVDSLSLPDGPVPTYLDMIRHNADLIVGALSGGER